MALSKPRAAIVHGQPVGPEKIQFAKLLRRTMTRPERMLWNAIRLSQRNGLHFRRQQIAGDFILDFLLRRGPARDLTGPDFSRSQR